jgi:hypothetical protein
MLVNGGKLGLGRVQSSCLVTLSAGKFPNPHAGRHEQHADAEDRQE